MNFDSGMSFDLADAKVASAPNITSISQKIDGDNTIVEFALIGEADVHSFREEGNYVVDVGFVAKTTQPKLDQLKRDEAKPEAQQPAMVPPAPQRSGEIAPPTSQDVIKQAGPAPAMPEPPPQPTGVEATPAPAPVQVAMPKPELKPELKPEPKPETPDRMMLAGADQKAAPLITGDSTAITVRRNSDGLRLTIPFAQATPAAVFVRADALWMVFDSNAPLDISQIARDGGAIVRDALRQPLQRGQAIRIRLNRPQLIGVSGDGQSWIVHAADVAPSAPQPLSAIRNVADPARASVTVPFAEPGGLHRLVDPDAGDVVLAVTALLPARGFVKRQSFVEFALLESVHGVAVQSNSDDVQAELAPDKIVIGRPGGLTLSAAEMMPERAVAAAKALLDVNTWREDRAADFVQRRDVLWTQAAQAVADNRVATRLDLARFYIANGFYVEARAAIDAFLHDQPPGSDDSNLLIVRALANILAGNPEQGLKDIANPVIGTGYDSRLWKAMAHARLGKWAEARELFKGVDFAIGALPLELQRIVIVDALRAALEVRDYAGVSGRLNELEIVGIGPDQSGYVALLRGRMAQALGREKDALADYRTAIAAPDRASASEAKLYEVELALKRGEMTSEQAQADLETLSVTWRGDSIEVKTLQLLARIYDKEDRFRDALMAARMATRLQPNSDVVRQMQDEAAALFQQLFNGSRSDDISERSDAVLRTATGERTAMPAVQALALFYEFRELTPIGRRGDEMIRRLADRLVAVDLLDQASELLQYQVDTSPRRRGAGAGRVAAGDDLSDEPQAGPRARGAAGDAHRRPCRRTARSSACCWRRARCATSAVTISRSTSSPTWSGREAIRLRSDIHWAARRWRECGRADRAAATASAGSEFAPLTTIEKRRHHARRDRLRAGRRRHRAVAAAREIRGEDGRRGRPRARSRSATARSATNSAEFATIAKMAAPPSIRSTASCARCAALPGSMALARAAAAGGCGEARSELPHRRRCRQIHGALRRAQSNRSISRVAATGLRTLLP